MAKKCIYCNKEIDVESVIDFCERCGKGVWGEKMFNAILKNMEDARDRGDINSKGLFVGNPDLKKSEKFS